MVKWHRLKRLARGRYHRPVVREPERDVSVGGTGHLVADGGRRRGHGRHEVTVAADGGVTARRLTEAHLGDAAVGTGDALLPKEKRPRKAASSSENAFAFGVLAEYCGDRPRVPQPRGARDRDPNVKMVSYIYIYIFYTKR